MYRLIISEKTRDPYGRALEILGSYNPHSKDLKVKADRIKYWLEKGSGISPTVNNLLIEKGIIEGEKMKASTAKKKKKAKDVSDEASTKSEKAPAESDGKTKEEKPEEKPEAPAEEK